MPKESDYGIKQAEWKLLDTGNPAFRPVGFKDWGKNMEADFQFGRVGNVVVYESVNQYWDRVRSEQTKIVRKRGY